jgi:hypothetical protein
METEPLFTRKEKTVIKILFILILLSVIIYNNPWWISGESKEVWALKDNARERGRKDGIFSKSNPYNKDSVAWDEWQKGYNETVKK